MKQKKRFVAFAWGLCALTAAYAQSNEFDLSSQRLEVQWVNPAPGEKMDHHGLVVNPTPRYMKLTNEGTIDISGGVKLESPLPTLLWHPDFATIDGESGCGGWKEASLPRD